ncbi:uncharacterized protein LOC123319045 [Coccinella septempunctata]|uniref:uncharacterized protein LOC123319045 n=1 Tax=Coccinella septempunctata TaxID=41139 RepID=UPI001D0968B5|nr:uncharacterized protein LOC123319045 [Coccinella septempunctata]
MLKHSALFLATVGFQLYGIVGFIVQGYSDGLRNELIEPLQLIVTALLDGLLMMTFFPFGERFRKLLQKMKNVSQEVPMNVSKGYIFLNKLTWIAFYANFTVICSVGLMSYFFDAHCEGRKLKGDKRYMCGLMSPVWYPFEIEDSSSWKVMFALYINIGSAIILSFYGATFVGFIGIGYIITLRIQDLTEQLMEFDEKNIQNLGQNFVFLVKYFSKIQEFVKDVNQTFGYCCIVVYVLITICTAFLGYICIIDGSVKNFASLCICIILQYAWCSVGQHLEDKVNIQQNSIDHIEYH